MLNSGYKAGKQLTLSLLGHAEAARRLSAASAEERGAVFTRREVVEFILDLTGYTTDQPLYKFRLLEPSFGEGDFLLCVVERLLRSYELHVSEQFRCFADLSAAIRAFEVHPESIARAREKLLHMLTEHGFSQGETQALFHSWIIEGDFLLAELPWEFTHVVGNPPYLRQELIPGFLLAEYRTRFSTMYDRADLYVPFIEQCLLSLARGGILGFICSDRWMKNKYGGPLRALIAEHFHLRYYVDMVDTPAFHSQVTAYPAITVIERRKGGPTRIAHRPHIDRHALGKLAQALRDDSGHEVNGVVEVPNVATGHEPWILHAPERLAVVRRLEAEFPLLEEAGCKVGIGVATGADKVFIGPYDRLDVEPDRKLPLVRTQDIECGRVEWKGLGVINPFSDDGSLVDLAKYPKLARYLETHAEVIRNRNCARKSPGAWYRTIDRIYPELLRRPKLLIPDIKGEAHVVHEDGQLYPHHNLYFITSEEWDLQALQVVLQSGIAKLFVGAYSTQMRGGYLRFQAQYLRRIRLPRWKDVPQALRNDLMNAARAGDTEACSRVTFDLYGLSPEDRAAIEGHDTRERS